MTARIDYAAVAPDVYKTLIGTHTALKRSGFDGNLMNLGFQRVSQLNGCAYCVDLHGREMRAGGEPPERLDGLAAWDESPYFTEREKAALAWAESVTNIATSRAPDHVYAEMRKHFSEADATHLTMGIALMNALNRIAIATGKEKTAAAAKMLDEQLGKTQFLAGDAFSYGDIPAAIMVRRYRDLVPERPSFPHVERWYTALAKRPPFDEHVTKIPLV